MEITYGLQKLILKSKNKNACLDVFHDLCCLFILQTDKGSGPCLIFGLYSLFHKGSFIKTKHKKILHDDKLFEIMMMMYYLKL